MKIISLSPKAFGRVQRGENELYQRDFKDPIKGSVPGEWVYLVTDKEYYIGYLNTFATNSIIGRVVGKVSGINNFAIEAVVAERSLNNLLCKAIDHRQVYKNFSDGCRLVHGGADNLPGLIVDKYKNCILIQINTAGIDRFRKLIKEVLIEKFPNHQVSFFDNKTYRAVEVLPEWDKDALPEVIVVEENGIKYSLSQSVIQKIGYYYDHRNNRLKLSRFIENIESKPLKGLDLFSYAGSWGLNVLKSGVDHITFVDQGNFKEIIENNTKLNSFEGKTDFIRGDVFKVLDEFNAKNQIFDLIISDPPAFKKSESNKNKALGGYQKLHKKCLELVNDGGLFVAASCTSGISLSELDKTVQDSANSLGKQVRLLDTGTQGEDHPFSSFNSKECYIKYLLYKVSKNILEIEYE